MRHVRAADQKRRTWFFEDRFELNKYIAWDRMIGIVLVIILPYQSRLPAGALPGEHDQLEFSRRHRLWSWPAPIHGANSKGRGRERESLQTVHNQHMFNIHTTSFLDTSSSLVLPSSVSVDSLVSVSSPSVDVSNVSPDVNFPSSVAGLLPSPVSAQTYLFAVWCWSA